MNLQKVKTINKGAKYFEFTVGDCRVQTANLGCENCKCYITF